MTEIRDRNVYILGAGFSAPSGTPVIHDFIDRSRIYFDNPSSNLDKMERQHFERFLDFKRRMSQASEKVTIDLDNIEELFGLVEISQSWRTVFVVTVLRTPSSRRLLLRQRRLAFCKDFLQQFSSNLEPWGTDLLFFSRC